MSDINTLLLVTEKDKKQIRDHYGKTEDDVRDDVSELKVWLGTQQHLPQNIGDQRLENILMRNKFRMEKTKEKIEAHQVLRATYSQFFNPDLIDPKSKAMQDVFRLNYFVGLPRLTENSERILVYKLRSSTEVSPCLDVTAFGFAFMNIMLSHDYSLSNIIICDLDGFNLRHWLTYDVITMYRAFKVYKDAFSGRIAGQHFINAPSFMNLIVAVLRTVLKSEKIIVHKSIDSLSSVVPIDYLPSDYGGSQGYLDDLQEKWIREVEFNLDTFRDDYNRDRTFKENMDSKRGFFGKMFA